MKYSRKMFAVFAVMGILIVSVSFLVYFQYRIRDQEKEIYNELQRRAEQISHQLDIALEKMEFAVSFTLSGTDMLDSINTLSRIDQKEVNKGDVSNSVRIVKANLATWYLTTNFHNVVVFNSKGIAITHDGKKNTDFTQNIFNRGNYRQKISGRKSGYYLWGPHTESWSENGEMVLSIVKEVKGYHESFIEVEYEWNKLDFPEEQFFYIFDKEQREIFSSGDSEKNEIMKLLEQHGEQNNWKMGTKNFLVSGWKSAKTGNFIVTLESREVLDKKIREIIMTSIFLILIVLICVLLYVHISARYLTYPVAELNQLVKRRELKNIDEPFDFHSNIVEVDFLGRSFEDLLERLSGSMKMEKRAVQLQMQAQFDALQAGINPHFIFNVLNVVANRGMMLEDDVICRICSKLGAILRYSTNTKERDAFLEEEIKYLDNYFYLIKARFQDGFYYECDISEDARKLRIPKLGLQQLAENCIKHGFKEKNSLMKILIRVKQSQREWNLEIQDNGSGFLPEVLEKLEIQLEQAKQNAIDQQNGFEIGGMGIVNTYLRFYYMYGERMKFNIENNDMGAHILIRIEREEQVEHV